MPHTPGSQWDALGVCASAPSKSCSAVPQPLVVFAASHASLLAAWHGSEGVLCCEHSCITMAGDARCGAVSCASHRTATLARAALSLLRRLPCHNSYNAEGGGGVGSVQQLGDNKLQLTFDAQGVYNASPSQMTRRQQRSQCKAAAVGLCVCVSVCVSSTTVPPNSWRWCGSRC